LYLHTELLDLVDRHVAGGWDLERLASRYGVEHEVHFDRSIRIGEGVSDAELAARMGACDVHLLPYDCGGWELTVLETAACGVPNVITDIATPPDYASAFAELVSPAARVQTPTGMKGYIDEGLAVAALMRLTRDHGHRATLGRRGIEAAAAYSWDRVGELWDQRLRAIAPPRSGRGLRAPR
jgi:glycosyltransferase involved in cell wall biosynthesis